MVAVHGWLADELRGGDAPTFEVLVAVTGRSLSGATSTGEARPEADTPDSHHQPQAPTTTFPSTCATRSTATDVAVAEDTTIKADRSRATVGYDNGQGRRQPTHATAAGRIHAIVPVAASGGYDQTPQRAQAGHLSLHVGATGPARPHPSMHMTEPTQPGGDHQPPTGDATNGNTRRQVGVPSQIRPRPPLDATAQGAKRGCAPPAAP